VKKIIFFLSLIFFIGCSNRVILPITTNPNNIKNDKLRYLKLNIKNDSISLKQNLLNQMYEINNIVPNYFIFNEYKSILNANVIVKNNQKTYNKIVKLYVKPPICKYNFYLCKSINGTIFCNTNKIAMKLDTKQYNKIKKNIFKNKQYILYNKKIYKLIKKCKPTHTTIKCEKQSIQINVDLNITDLNNKTLYSNNYTAYNIDDPCKNINYYENRKTYKTRTLNENINSLSIKLAQNIINDIAPHREYINVEMYDSPTIKMENKDKKILKDIISKKDIDRKNIDILENLYQKYPKSCIIPYDLSVYLIYNNKYNEAKYLLNNVLHSKCDKEIKQSANIILLYLENAY